MFYNHGDDFSVSGGSFYDIPGVRTQSYALQLFHTLPYASHDMRKRWYPRLRPSFDTLITAFQSRLAYALV